MNPLYIHDCDGCVFLGISSGKSDLYFCPDSVTLIARHSSIDSDYTSGMAFVGINPAITEAYVKAYRAGLVDQGMLDNLPERLNLAFPMFLGLAYLWASLSLPHLIRIAKQLVKGKGAS